MPDPTEPGTKTVRIDSDAAKKLQTISALKDQMGQRFKSVEFLNGLVVDPIEVLFEATVKEFAEFQARTKKRKPKPDG